MFSQKLFTIKLNSENLKKIFQILINQKSLKQNLFYCNMYLVHELFCIEISMQNIENMLKWQSFSDKYKIREKNMTRYWIITLVSSAFASFGFYKYVI